MSTGKDLLALFHAGLLPRDGFEGVMENLGLHRRWSHWGNLLLLCLGVGLLLAGIVFFIAYNWLTMPKALKLGGLQVLTVVCAIAAWQRGLHVLSGRAFLFAACVLVGVFLAAFGQVYQTGADAYELFRGWALLTLIWVIASRAPAHWMLWLVVTNLWIYLYWEQVVAYRWETHYSVWLLMALVQLLGLAGFELGKKRDYFWVAQTWPRWVLVPVLLFQLAAPATLIIADDKYDRPYAWLVMLSLVAAIVGGYRYYRHVGRDLFALTCVGATIAWVVFAYAFKLLIDISRSDSCFAFLTLGILAVVLLGGLVRWVRRLSAAMQTEAGS